MPIDPARGLQLRADSVATRLYQERLYSSGPAGARRAGLEFVCVFGHDGLSWNEIRARAADFACEWADATYEKERRRASTTSSSTFSASGGAPSHGTKNTSGDWTTPPVSSTCSGRASCWSGTFE